MRKKGEGRREGARGRDKDKIKKRGVKVCVCVCVNKRDGAEIFN